MSLSERRSRIQRYGDGRQTGSTRNDGRAGTKKMFRARFEGAPPVEVPVVTFADVVKIHASGTGDAMHAATSLSAAIQQEATGIEASTVRQIYVAALRYHAKIVTRRRTARELSTAIDVIANWLCGHSSGLERDELFRLTCDRGFGGTAHKYFRRRAATAAA